MTTEAPVTTRATRRLRPLAAALLAGAALVGAACVPETPPAPTTTTTTTESTTTTTSSTIPEEPVCEGEPGTASNGTATLTVSKVTCLEVGDIITVFGTGYSATGNLGTRAPFFNQPSGNYVVFGKFANVWRPSAGAPSSARVVPVQHWAIPEPTFTNAGGQLPYILLAANGSFSTTLEITAINSTHPNLGFATYGGSGSVNANEEIFIPASFAPVEAG